MGTSNMSLLAATSYGLPINTIHLGLHSQVFDLCAEGQSIGSIHSPWRQDLRRAGCVASIILQDFRFRWLVNSSRPTVYYWRRYLPSAGVITLRYSYGLGLLGERLLRQELDWGE